MRVPLLGLFIAFLSTPAAVSAQDVGPVVGHVDATSAHLLIRRGEKKQSFRLELLASDGSTVVTTESRATSDTDFVAHFEVGDLQPGTLYRYRISLLRGDKVTRVADSKDCTFTTAAADRRRSETLCFTSCVDIEKSPLWREIASVDPDLLVFMGDTPYIDTADLSAARRLHREFLGMPGLVDLVRSTPTVGTWDDHDFGRNNGNGRNMHPGKENTRRAFVEYRAHERYGTGREGVFHKIDRGIVEVFLLDPRYFSQTEPSPVSPDQPTCYGEEQWTWLLESLRASQATFKILASGAIWQDKKNSETDDMFTYWYERDALFDFIEREQISGVVLLGGDIHVSRHLIHRERVGYDLHDFVVSPGHERTITSLDVYHPSLEWSLVEGHQLLEIVCEVKDDRPTLTARFRQPKGRVHRVVELSIDELTPPSAEGIEKGWRAHWSFTSSLDNEGSFGAALEAEASHRKLIQKDPARGSVLRLDRGREQFISVKGNPLDDNSDRHTFAFWFQPESLPKHGSDERMFLIESTAEGKPSGDRAWHLSLGLRASSDASQVNLQLYSDTLAPAARLEAAPTSQSQGGFDLHLDRKELAEWMHVTCTFDSKSWTIFLNGERRVTHRLPMPGPASEFGGFIIGGHREAAGRNFDGSIDDLSLWSRVLTDAEIESIARPSEKN